MKDYEELHKANLKRYQKQIAAIYRKAAEEMAKLGASVQGATTPFSFDNYPAVKRKVDLLLAELAEETRMVVINGVRAEFTLANNNVNEIANQLYIAGKGKELLTAEESTAFFKRYTSTSTAAAEKFVERKIRGLSLSDRVWNTAQQFRTDVEIVVEQGIGKGRSAAAMAKDIKAALNEPNRLFRRVKQEDGTLALSESAKAYHPGQGVYRSSYKNAIRLTGTETNIAYRSAFHDRIQDQDWITGIEVRLSNNHTCKDGKGGLIPGWTDICDDLKGVYPKDFKFTGWHPACRCEQITVRQDPIQAMREFKEGITTAKQIEDLPPQFNDWMDKNAARMQSAAEKGTVPYFLRDNEKFISNE